jgi:LysM repeat protein
LLKRTVKLGALITAVAFAGVTGLASAASADTSHVVRPGETLSGIVGANWAAVAAANGIANPNLIYPGDVIRLDGASSGGHHTVAAPAPARASAPAPAATSSTSGGTVWDQLAQCESSGNWSISTGNGYYGGLQFSQQSWQGAGGSGNPANASRAEQIRVAENLKAMQGWGAWPACSQKLGLR